MARVGSNPAILFYHFHPLGQLFRVFKPPQGPMQWLERKEVYPNEKTELKTKTNEHLYSNISWINCNSWKG